MQIIQLGLTYKTAPLEIRERCAIPKADFPMVLQRLCSRAWDDPTRVLEAALLSTCNRLEVYAVADNAHEGQQEAINCLAGLAGMSYSVLIPHLEVRQDAEAVVHLCHVACGLDSMMLGESQIQGQVIEAHQLALACGVAGNVIDALFRTAIRAGKRARTETAINEHATSISHAAVGVALQAIRDPASLCALVIGAGKMAKLAGKQLRDHGVGRLVVANRSTDRAASLAEHLQGEAVAWDNLGQALEQADVVIASVAAPHAILNAHSVSDAMRTRPARPLCIVDIGVPRNVEPAVGSLPNVRLHDIDDLQQVVDANLDQRKCQIPRVQAIIDAETARFMAWLKALDVVPTIVDLRERAERIRETEFQRAVGKLGRLSEREQNVIRALSRRLMNKMLHQPTVRLKEHANAHETDDYVRLVRDLFGLGAAEIVESGEMEE